MADRHCIIEPPNPRQREFFLARERYVAYGGARGGGKSWALRRKAALMCAKYPGIRVLIIRRSYPELRENHVLPLRAEIGAIASWRESDKSFEFPNSSRIRLGYCDAEADVSRYQGAEFDVLCIDEATQLTEYQFSALAASVRGVNAFPKRVYLTCNPGGVGHEWVKRLFIDRDFRLGEDPDQYRFIPARVEDNTALALKNPEYLRMLEALPDGLRQAWREGDWNVLSGRYFTEFDPCVHVVPQFDPPPGWRRYVTMDYGLDMLAAYLIVLSPDGGIYVTKEIYRSDVIVSEAARMVGSLCQKPYAFLAPRDLWARQRESGRTTAEIFAENGIALTPVGGGRVDGWLALKEAMKVSVGLSGERSSALRIFPSCQNLIRTLPLLRHDEHDPNDCANTPHEHTHAPDALRYFCSYRTAAAAERLPSPRVNFFFERPKKSPLGYGERTTIV